MPETYDYDLVILTLCSHDAQEKDEMIRDLKAIIEDYEQDEISAYGCGGALYCISSCVNGISLTSCVAPILAPTPAVEATTPPPSSSPVTTTATATAMASLSPAPEPVPSVMIADDAASATAGEAPLPSPPRDLPKDSETVREHQSAECWAGSGG
jgi:hypothetical protein